MDALPADVVLSSIFPYLYRWEIVQCCRASKGNHDALYEKARKNTLLYHHRWIKALDYAFIIRAKKIGEPPTYSAMTRRDPVDHVVRAHRYNAKTREIWIYDDQSPFTAECLSTSAPSRPTAST